MKRLYIEVSEIEYFALETVALDPREWLKNFADSRAFQTLKGLQLEVATRCIDEGVQLPIKTEEVIALGVSKGWIKTAAQQQAEEEVSQVTSEPA